jgi:hypothetical protein
VDPLQLLERTDKWFLGGGTGAIYAPPFPRFLLAPGFWDECHYADIRLGRLFTCILLDAQHRPIRLVSEVQSWRPDRLVILHQGASLTIRETRCVVGHSWVGELELLDGASCDLLVWSLQDLKPSGYGIPWQSLVHCELSDNSLDFAIATAWPGELEPDRSATEDELLEAHADMLEPLKIHLSIGADAPRISHTVNLAQRHDDAPLWELSVLPEKFKGGRLAEEFKVNVGTDTEGLLHMVQHYRLTRDRPVQVACGVGLTSQDASRSRQEAIRARAANESETHWRHYFKQVPQFQSSDAHLNAAYWYRWYGLHLNTVDIPALSICGREGQFAPFVTEGVGFFRNFITYSAQAHLREVAWMHDPGLAQGIAENLARVQRADGSYPGHNYSCRPSRDFYHADFATGIETLRLLHAVPVTPKVVASLSRYAVYLSDVRRGPQGSCAIWDQNETGQEYMSRYAFARDDADQWTQFSIGGVDSTTYLALLLSWLKVQERDAEWIANRENECLSALRKMFDEDAAFFCDIDDTRRSPARPAAGFYPLLVLDLALAELQRILDRWLLNEDEFWLPFGFPATAWSDTTFSPEAEWKEKRMNCPWNGRSWPMVNSHLVDVLARAGRIALPSAKKAAAEGLLKSLRMMFHDQDPQRPNSYEHYNPFTGVASLYRGYDDYMHSWIVDLILRHVVGVQPGKTEIDPLPLDMDWLECSDIPNLGARMHVRIKSRRADVEWAGDPPPKVS